MKDTGNFLDLVPEKNCRWDKTGDGRSYLLVPRFKNRWVKKIAMKFGRSEFVKIYFDQTGTGVWGLIDGNITVAEIGERMEKENGEQIEQVYDRLTEFISILARNKFVNLKKPL
jgi:hypothetical protein